MSKQPKSAPPAEIIWRSMRQFGGSVMLRVQSEHVFALPVDVLWHVLGDFGNTGKWSGRPAEACVQQGQGIGALRTMMRRTIEQL